MQNETGLQDGVHPREPHCEVKSEGEWANCLGKGVKEGRRVTKKIDMKGRGGKIESAGKKRSNCRESMPKKGRPTVVTGSTRMETTMPSKDKVRETGGRKGGDDNQRHIAEVYWQRGRWATMRRSKLLE